ncbi:subtilase family protein [Saccharopolyspora erythraea NRRL 2338]|uniref:Protease n=2 Tax=Saccharopolyspora erythraea TaxID=1836 RepID=A4FFI6_SACEN|nr:S8 family serine peptidase [Saccharopolyspora erythraea]EQD81357.1 protease [Saccharopolyspora erythraea D]PFG96532.1 subtilase family protein [Saccharopolyspora erythraea NRRL 2338]QRK93022.1 S8 family serine peptidase [Saccharopolyspora erythraea]CAM02811.1 protease [Saccharopolyspora erythraea NRRL 2338]
MAGTESSSTGRYLVLLEDDATVVGARELTRLAGIRTVNTADVVGASAAELFGAADGVVLNELGIALVTAGSDQASALSEAVRSSGPIAAFEAERTVYAIDDAAPAAEAPPAPVDGALTWGLQAVGVNGSTPTGAGVRVAVLDTGLDLQHPDFAGRDIVTGSFVPGEDVHDGHGHGTHVIGTACGPRTPAQGPGYGIASEASIYAGKVLANGGTGSDGGILSGISWAISNGCSVVSMSLGAATEPGQPFSQAFERVAQRAMARGTLIIAAAGNESSRGSGTIAPVGHPANCPSIMAVGAVDARNAIAEFSCGTVDQIGQVDLVGPGVDVHSSWPGAGSKSLSGTSMATPHVAGVATLYAQQHHERAWGLWARLAQKARRLPLPSTDVGAGLVQVP